MLRSTKWQRVVASCLDPVKWPDYQEAKLSRMDVVNAFGEVRPSYCKAYTEPYNRLRLAHE